MQANVEKVSELERRLTVTVPAEQIENEVLKRLKEMASKAKLPGFRPGKVPFAMMQQKYEEAVRFEVVQDTINSTYTESLRKENLTPVSMPKFDAVNAKPHEALSYVATFEVYPEIKVDNLEQISAEKIVVDVTDADINATMEKLSKVYGTWKEITDTTHPAQTGERVLVDYEVAIAGNSRESKRDYAVDLGTGRNLPEFEQPLFASKVGDELHFAVPFPENYFDKQCAGQQGDFIVKVKKISQLEPALVDDEFAKKMGIAEGVAALREEIRKNLTGEIQRLSMEKFKAAVIDSLLAKYPFTVPKGLVAAEVERALKERQAKNAKEISQEERSALETAMQRQVAGGMLLAEIAKKYEVKVSSEQLRAKISELAAHTPDANKALKWYYDEPKRLAQLESYLLEDELFKRLEKLLSITEKKMNYDEAVKLFGGAGI